jgi:DNA-damage-inducible protein J
MNARGCAGFDVLLVIVIQLHYIVQLNEEINMAANALVQTRIDADVRDRASAVLENMGLTVSDAVRILLTRTANEGRLPLELISTSEAHDAWFRAKVLQALEDTRPDVPDEEAEARFAARRAAARRKAGSAG